MCGIHPAVTVRIEAMSINLEKDDLGVGISDGPDSSGGSGVHSGSEHCHCHRDHIHDETCSDFCQSAQRFFDEASKAVNDAPDTTDSYTSGDISAAKPFAVLSYLGSGLLFFLPLAVTPKSPFGKFHANQALVLLVCTVILNTAFAISTAIIGRMLPNFLEFIVDLINFIPKIVCFIYMIIGIVNSASGKARELPFIGAFKLIK